MIPVLYCKCNLLSKDQRNKTPKIRKEENLSKVIASVIIFFWLRPCLGDVSRLLVMFKDCLKRVFLSPSSI